MPPAAPRRRVRGRTAPRRHRRQSPRRGSSSRAGPAGTVRRRRAGGSAALTRPGSIFSAPAVTHGRSRLLQVEGTPSPQAPYSTPPQPKETKMLNPNTENNDQAQSETVLNWSADAPKGGSAVMRRILKDGATVPL